MEKRITLIVLDSLGVGNSPDADKYGDLGSNTLFHILDRTNINIPNLKKLGILNQDNENIIGSYGTAQEISSGKGTIEGHWEIAGIETKKEFETFPDGFPKEMLDIITEATGYSFLCNKPASGTEVIKEFGQIHIQTKQPIIYTSADSVFQIACHEEVFGLDKLYELCETVRKILNTKWNVSRVIARPFLGTTAENFVRTSNRRDFSIIPPQKNLLNILYANDINVVGVGKIGDIFCEKGLSQSIHTSGNTDGIQKTIEIMQKRPKKDEFLFVNLVDFDSHYGHRRNVDGYANALKEFDNALPEILSTLKNDDILIITADHGCDPTFKGTDHTRENVPILIVGPSVQPCNIGCRKTFADIGQTICETFKCVPALPIGESFLNIILKRGDI